MYITYEQVIHETQKTLKGLKKFLGIHAPFSEHYSPLSLKGWFFGMGTVGGDKSDKIVSGKIIRQSSRPSISLPEEIVSGCSKRYEKAHATLQKYCSSINDYI